MALLGFARTEGRGTASALITEESHLCGGAWSSINAGSVQQSQKMEINMRESPHPHPHPPGLGAGDGWDKLKWHPCCQEWRALLLRAEKTKGTAAASKCARGVSYISHYGSQGQERFLSNSRVMQEHP